MRASFAFIIGKQSCYNRSLARFISGRGFPCPSIIPERLSVLSVGPTEPGSPPRKNWNEGNWQRRYFSPPSAFATEGHYHRAANNTLERIQDAVEEALEDQGILEPYEVTLADGVLTLVLPPHGTWVINKQTPNRQLWWSSPISGPRRYEFEGDDWVYTRDDSHSINLSQTLREELLQVYQIDINDM